MHHSFLLKPYNQLSFIISLLNGFDVGNGALLLPEAGRARFLIVATLPCFHLLTGAKIILRQNRSYLDTITECHFDN